MSELIWYMLKKDGTEIIEHVSSITEGNAKSRDALENLTHKVFHMCGTYEPNKFETARKHVRSYYGYGVE